MPDDAAGVGLGARLQRLAHALYVSHGVGQGRSVQMRVVRPRASKLSAHLRYGPAAQLLRSSPGDRPQ